MQTIYKSLSMSTSIQSKTLRILGILFLSLFMHLIGRSQTAGTAVTMTLQNAVQTSSTEFTYDVMLTNTGTTTLYLRGYSAGINYASGMGGTGTLTHTFVSRDAALVNIPVVTPGITTSTNHLRFTTVNATSGNEVLMTPNVPYRLATMKVTNTVAFPADFNPALNLQLVTASGKTQCIATCYVGTAVSANNYAINGLANTPATTPQRAP